MKLRTHILYPIDSGSPDYNICNRDLDIVNNTIVKLILKVDNFTIINTNNLAGLAFPLPSVTTLENNITINSVDMEFGSCLVVDINLPNISSSTTVEFEIKAVGYLSFKNIFKVFGYDIGNNPLANNVHGQPINYNEEFNIILINELNNIVDNKQTKAYSSFIKIKEPFTNNIYLFKNNSSQGITKYYDYENNLLGSQDNLFLSLCNKDCINLYQENLLIGVDNDNGACGCNNNEVVSSCQTPLIEVCKNNFIVNHNTQISCNDCSDNIITNETNNKAITDINYNELLPIYINDTWTYPYNEQELTYNLFNSSGILVSTQSFNYNINPPYFIFNPFNYEFTNFNNLDFGDYLLEVILETPNLFKSIKRYEFKSCNWLNVEKINCNKYQINNQSFDDLTIFITKMNNDKLFIEYKTVIVNKLTNFEINFEKDGIYKIYTKRDNKEYNIIIPTFCNLQNCLVGFIQKNICNPCTTDIAKQDIYNFNTVLLSSFFVFSLIHNKNYINNIFEIIDNNILEDLFQLQVLIDRSEQYCNNCLNSTSNDCGCK